MQKIIGRKAERAELQQIYESGKPELVVVYGRRRVGKTFLIREFFKNRMAFYHTGLSQQEVEGTSMKENQLQNFAASLRRYGTVGQKMRKDRCFRHFYSDMTFMRSDKRTIETWQGFAFETVCWNHIEQIKKTLGIPSVQTVEFPWRATATEEYQGAQIDLIIRRSDKIINLCEMKFCIADYIIDKNEDAKIRNKIATYQRLTKCRESIFPILITTYGLENNKYRDLVQKVITMDDLFES